MKPDGDGYVRLQREFLLTEPLGKGGMGTVSEARAEDFGGSVAVKSLKPEWQDDATMRQRFEEEARVMSIMDHPGSLPVYGVGQHPDGAACVIMKKVSGQTLAELLQKRGRNEVASVPWRRRLLMIFREVCETMAYAHQRGIIHRDLKPDNILIDEHGSVFVIDWGLASGGDGHSPVDGEADRLVMGTPGYMAPEQVEPELAAVGPPTDIFALGAILYEILTGEPPFDESGGRKAMLDAVYKEPKAPRRHNWLLSRSLSAVCMKALSKDPAKRYATAESLVDDIRAYQEGRAVSVARPGPIEWCVLKARRRPMAAAVAGAATTALLALMAFVCLQLWIDQHQADKVFAQLEEIEHHQLEIKEEMDQLTELAAGLPVGSPGHSDLALELHHLELRWLLREVHALNLLSSLHVLRFIHLDSEVRPLAYEQVIGALRHCMKYEHFELASSLAEDLIEAYDEGLSDWAWSDSQLEEIKRLGAAAAEGRNDL